jgi:hypothetical protein
MRFRCGCGGGLDMRSRLPYTLVDVFAMVVEQPTVSQV